MSQQVPAFPSSPSVIKDLDDLRFMIENREGMASSISPPLQVGNRFMMAMCQGPCDENCSCIDLPLSDLPEAAHMLFSVVDHRYHVHSLKEIMVWFKRRGINLIPGIFLDISLAAYLLSPPEPDKGEDWRKFQLKSLVRDYLKEGYPFWFEQVDQQDYPEAFYNRLREDAQYIWCLGAPFVSAIVYDYLNQPYWELEIELTCVLAEMEVRGIELDHVRIRRAKTRLEEASRILRKQLEEAYGKPLYLSSHYDVRNFLYEVCGIPMGRREQIDDDRLKGLSRQNPYVFKLLTLQRLQEALRFFAKVEGQKHCYPKWWLTRTAVGRVVCTNPALQSLPKPFRRYLSPGAGKVFIKADFSAFQLRLLAHLSQDPHLIDLFQSGRNPHDETQARLLARGLNITRAQGKTVNFSICYGGTAWSLKDNLGLGFKGLQTAQQIMNEMKEIYPEVFKYLKGVAEEIQGAPENQRYVRSIRGRRRSFTHSGKLTARERRQAANAVVLMLEADVFKKTVLELERATEHEGLPIRIVLLLHDGIWFTCPEGIQQKARRLIKQVMETAVELSVPLVVGFEQ
jgi:DNA polymerase-1